MNKQAFAILEFDSLRALVRRNAQTEMGRARIASLEPINNIDELRQALSAVAESVELRRHGAHLSFDSLADPSESISRLKIEGTALDPLAILDLARLCERALNARAAILAEHENYPTLFEIVAALPAELKKLTSLLTKKILPSGELDDRASPQLASIRRDIANACSRITGDASTVLPTAHLHRARRSLLSRWKLSKQTTNCKLYAKLNSARSLKFFFRFRKTCVMSCRQLNSPRMRLPNSISSARKPRLQRDSVVSFQKLKAVQVPPVSVMIL